MPKLSREVLPQAGVPTKFRPFPREIRARAAYLIAVAGGREVIPDLIIALDDPQPDVRIIAAKALRSFGQGARSALPALSSITNDMRPGAYYCSPSMVSQTAVEAIRTISGTDRKTHPLSW
jgi:HEAT repeat protein